jgi:hypothetical protein
MLALGMLPITSKLLPVRARNVAYLAEVAALTRIVTGVVRVVENRPSQQKDTQLSQNEKRQAIAERFFVEILGTAGYMTFLHLGQDLVDKVQAEIRKKAPLPKALTAELEAKIDKLGFQVGEFNTLIEKLYNPHANVDKPYSGMLYRVLYEDELHENGKLISLPKATLASLQKKIIEELQARSPHKNEAALELIQQNAVRDFKEVLKHFKDLENFACKNNIWAGAGILTGVVLSATVGGTLTQWMNDRLVAPTAKKWLNKKYAAGQAKPAAPVAPAIHKASAGDAASVAPAASSPALSQAAPLNPFNFSTMTMPLPPNPPPIAPVYLPNPKMQPPGAAFAANVLPRPYSTPLPNPMSGGHR